MNSSLLDLVEESHPAILVTILSTEGHTYKKRGDKALYIDDSPLPVWGNLGTTCVDPHIVEAGASARRDRRPARIVIDTTDPADIHHGTGTFCGGRIEVLIEPVLEEHKRIYRQVRSSLDDGKPVTLDHDMTTGEVIITDGAAVADADHYIETLQPARRLCIFGATPLAGQLVRILQAMHFSIHISDWREGYLATLKDLPQVTMHLSTWPVDAEAFALVMSHNHERDLESLRSALSVGCRYVGLLSSISRRDHILQQLGEEGFSDEQLAAVHSPVGIDIHGRSDAEIATSIVAQLIQVKNR